MKRSHIFHVLQALLFFALLCVFATLLAVTVKATRAGEPGESFVYLPYTSNELLLAATPTPVVTNTPGPTATATSAPTPTSSPTAIPGGDTVRVSLSASGIEGNAQSTNGSISADGRFVAFQSFADNLVAGDSNNVWDIFVHDRQTGATTRVSVSSSGAQSNELSTNPAISADGRYVAFESDADNLVTGDTNVTTDVFVHDRQTGATTRVSVSSSGEQADRWSLRPSISADGRYVAFESPASNLVAGDGNDTSDIFVHDRQTGATTRVSLSSSAVEGNGSSNEPAISADGRYVAFYSGADNLVAGDSNFANDVFVHDRQTGDTTLVSVDSNGLQGNGSSDMPAISADGRFVAFPSEASNLVAGDSNFATDVFVHDRQTGATTMVSVNSNGLQGNLYSAGPVITVDGRYVAFLSDADNLAAGDSNSNQDVFVHDRQTGATTMVSVNSNDLQGNDWSHGPSISADGRYVAFMSQANNLVPGDNNDAFDVFVRDRGAP